MDRRAPEQKFLTDYVRMRAELHCMPIERLYCMGNQRRRRRPAACTLT
uniref:Uncharacterized protein n=1 Tax=Setaria italica TaxID=4555 RepID=K4APA9_SETIT